MSLLSYKIEPKTTTYSGVYNVETQYTVNDGVIIVKFEVPSSEVEEKIKQDGFFTFNQEQENIYACTKEGRTQIGCLNTQKRVVLAQINFNVPENKKFYSYEDALEYYKKAYDKQLLKNKELKETLNKERALNQKANTKYKKIVKSLNKLIGELLKG